MGQLIFGIYILIAVFATVGNYFLFFVRTFEPTNRFEQKLLKSPIWKSVLSSIIWGLIWPASFIYGLYYTHRQLKYRKQNQTRLDEHIEYIRGISSSRVASEIKDIDVRILDELEFIPDKVSTSFKDSIIFIWKNRQQATMIASISDVNNIHCNIKTADTKGVYLRSYGGIREIINLNHTLDAFYDEAYDDII